MSNTHFPAKGLSWDVVEKALADYKVDDIDWAHGRAPMYVFYADDALYDVVKGAYNAYFSENALGAKAFPSLVRLESEVLAMACEIMNGGPEAGGSLTSGGSESIVLAVKTARDFARAEGRLGRRDTGKLVLPSTAHPAYDKAAQMMDLDAVRVPVREDYLADVDAMAAAIDDRTIFVVGSAPGFSHGVYDPIADLGAMTAEKNVWLHVDACIGGYLARHVRALGYRVPDFDFSVPGVTSISADLHKMGFAAKPASTILYRDGRMMEHQRFRFSDWPRGVYDTPNITGTRPGGAIAAAWATLKYLGADGYREIAKQIMDIRQRLIDGIATIPDLQVLGDPEICIVAFGSDTIDIHAVADRMGDKGWMIGRNATPAAIHIMLTPVHGQIMDEYVSDLREAAEAVRDGRVASRPVELNY